MQPKISVRVLFNRRKLILNPWNLFPSPWFHELLLLYLFFLWTISLSVWSKMIPGPTSDKTPLCILSYRHLDRKTNLQILNFMMLTNILEMWFWNFCKERRVYPDKWGEMILFFRDEPKHDNPLVLVIITMICNVFHEGSYIDAIT